MCFKYITNRAVLLRWLLQSTGFSVLNRHFSFLFPSEMFFAQYKSPGVSMTRPFVNRSATHGLFRPDPADFQPDPFYGVTSKKLDFSISSETPTKTVITAIHSRFTKHRGCYWPDHKRITKHRGRVLGEVL